MHRPVAVLVSPVWPQPGGSGRALRAWDWLRELSAGHELHVWTPQAQAATAPWPPGVQGWAGPGDLQPGSARARRLGWLVPALGLHWPQTIAHWQLPMPHAAGLSAMVRAIGDRPVARLVAFRLYSHGVAAWLRERLPVAQAEMDLDDWDSATMGSTAGALWRMGRRLEALLAWRESLQYRLLERRLPQGYDTCWLAAREDLAAFPGARLRPNRLPAPAPAPATPSATPSASVPATGCFNLLFVGSLDYAPNQEAALLLAEQVAPLLHGRLPPPWSLAIAGARPPSWLRHRLGGPGHVQLHADLPDLSPLYADCSVALLPVMAGGGTKLKTLEALARGKAVVASAHAVRGLALEAGKHYLPAETPPQFAQAVLDLHAQPGLRAQLAQAGRAWFVDESRRADAEPGACGGGPIP